MVTNVIIILSVLIVGGIFVLDHLVTRKEKEEAEERERERLEREAARNGDRELKPVKAVTAQVGDPAAASNARRETADGRTVDLRILDQIVFACEAGMGTSAIGAIVLQGKLEAAGLSNLRVIHCPVFGIPEDARYIVCPKEVAIQTADRHPTARVIPIDQFMDAPEYDQIAAEFVEARSNKNQAGQAEDYHGGVLIRKNIRMNLPSVDKETAIRAIGNALVETGYVTPRYVEGMLAKEETFNTCIGNYLAIPHGIESVIGEIRNSGLAIFGYPDGIDWGEGETAKLVIAVASSGDEHIDTLARIAGNCGTEEEVEEILRMDVDQIYDLFVS